jgi:glutamine synthetase
MRLQFTDILGINKNVEIPSSQFEKALAGDIMFDGSSIEGSCASRSRTCSSRRSLDTFRVFPVGRRGSRICRLICDINTPDGAVPGDPRGDSSACSPRRQMGYATERGDGSGVLPLQARA